MFRDVEFIINYVPLNIIFETLAFSIGLMIFGVSWVTQRYRPSLQTLLVGLGFLGGAILDFAHVLSYQVLPDYFTANTPDKAINFWFAARTITVITLLGVAFLPSLNRIRPSPVIRVLLLSLLLMLVFWVHWGVLFYSDALPATYLAGQGPTDFKVHFEYGLICAYIVAAAGLARRFRTDGYLGHLYLAASALTMAMGEYFFTVYVDFTDAYNIFGHLYKIITYAFLYRALFSEGIYEPYQSLQDARSRLQATISALPDSLFEVSGEGDYLSIYATGSSRSPASHQQLVGRNVREFLSEQACTRFFDALAEAGRDGHSHGVRVGIADNGSTRYVGLSVSKKLNAGRDSFLVLSRDVTELVRQEQRILHETRLNKILLGIHSLSLQQSEQAMLDMCARETARLTDSPLALIEVCHDGRQVREPVGFYSTRPDITEAASLLDHDDAPGLPCRQAQSSRQPVCWNEAQYFGANPLGFQRAVSIPADGGEQAGLVISLFDKAEAYSERDLEALGIIAATLWNKIRQHRQELVIHRLSRALEQNPYPVIITDAEVRIQYVNPAFTEVSGYRLQDVVGRNPGVLKSGKTPRRVYDEMWQKLEARQEWKGELINRRRNGELYIELASIYPITDSQGTVVSYVAHKEDITQSKVNEERIRQLSEFDQLTGLFNKAAFEAQLDRRIAAAARQQSGFSLLWLDLDNFKSVNDSLGFVAGDELLIAISNRLRNVFGNAALIGRPVGGAFAALIEGNEQDKVALLAEQLLEQIQQPVSVSGKTISISASMGISTYPLDGDDGLALFKAAELAMYRVKQDGRNGLRFYAPEMQRHSERALALSTALKKALENNELSLVFQPQLDLVSRRMTGAEALLRWHHPQWGPISPAEFIPLAEQNGLIVSIGWWVVDRVLEQLVRLREQGRDDITIAINVSSLQFVQPDFVDELKAGVKAKGIAASAVEIELTESVAMVNPQEMGEKMSELSAAGFSISIDDFGTGYSSMSYLKRFSVDKIKIDKSFVDEVTENHEDKTIVRAIIQMARSLGISTIAEGVETPEQAERLQAKGCDAIQGYWYSKPLPQKDFETFIGRA